MLRRQARFGPSMTDPGYMQRLCCYRREGRGCAHNLTAAFSKRAVNIDHQWNPSSELSANDGLHFIQ
jgi:hypothetical protein